MVWFHRFDSFLEKLASLILVYIFENQFVIQINQCHLSIGTDDKGLGWNVSRRNIVKDIARIGNGTALFTFFEQEVGENVIQADLNYVFNKRK